MDPITMMALAGAGSGIASSLFGGKSYKKAGKQMDKYYNQAQSYLQPYSQQGQEAYGHVNNAMQSLMNPSELNDRFLADYKQSDASRYAQGRAMNNGLDMLASMGMLGSTPGLQALQAGASQIGAEDEERHMKRMIDQYIQGAGLAQGIYGVGGNAAGQMGQNATNMGNNMAEMAYGRSAGPSQMFGNLMGTAANVGGAYYGMKGANDLANAWRTTGGNNSNNALPAYLGGTGYSAGGY